MRLVRYTDSAVEGMVFDFHPQITVIRGLPRAARLRVMETAEAIPAGMEPVSNSIIEAHGIQMNLTAENLALLELHQRLDVVIAPTDLPVATEEPDPSMDNELAQARETANEADARYEQVLRSISQFRRQKEQLIEERLRLSRNIESARSNLDNFAEAGLREAQDELATIERMAEGMRAEEADLTSRAEQARELESRIDSLSRELTGLLNANSDGVRSAFSALKLALEPVVVPSTEAQSLADEIGSLQRRLALSPEVVAVERRIEAAEQRRSAARDELVRVERDSRSPGLDPELVDALETNRDELFPLLRSRRTSHRSKKRHSQLLEREQVLLSDLGFASWSAYLLNEMSDAESIAGQSALNAARVAVATAEQDYATATSERLHNVVLRELNASLAAAVSRGKALLGHDGEGDLIGALQRHTIVAVADSDAVESAAERLRSELDAVGVSAGRGTVAVVETAARTWLEAREDVETRTAQLSAEMEALRSQRRSLGASPRRIAASVGVRPELALVPTRNEALARVEAEAARLERHQAAVARLSELRAREELLTGHEADLQRNLLDAERMAGIAAEARQASHSALSQIESQLVLRGSSVAQAPVEDPVAAVEWYVLARLAQQRAVSYAGSVPLVIDDAFAQWDFEDVERVHDRLERMSEAVQIVYFSDSSRVVDWAFSKGDRKAVVIDFTTMNAVSSGW